MPSQHSGGENQREIERKKGFKFPKNRRILKRKEFLVVQKLGKKYYLGPAIAAVYPTENNPTRIGFVTSKKVGKAPFRNRLRRLMREAARRILIPRLDKGFDIVLIAKKNLSRDISQNEFDRAAEKLCQLIEKNCDKMD